jgi:hypothetical protein
MLRDYDLEHEIFNQYLTNDIPDNKKSAIVMNPHKKSKYKRNVITNDELVEKQYGLTKQEVFLAKFSSIPSSSKWQRPTIINGKLCRMRSIRSTTSLSQTGPLTSGTLSAI